MTALWVIAGIIAFLALLFFLLFLLVARVRFRFDTDTGVFGLSIRVLFVNIKLLPANEKKKRKKQLKKAKKLAKRKNPDGHVFTEKKQNTISEMQANAADTAAPKKTVKEKVEAFTRLAANICEKIKLLVPGVMGALSLDIKKLDVVVGGEDAAQAAIGYGAVCGAVESLYAVGNSCKKLNVSDKVFVAVDYLEPKFRCEFDIVLKVRVFRILTTVLKAFL